MRHSIRSSRFRFGFLTVAIGLIGVGCTSGGEPSPSDTPAAVSPSEPTAEPAGAVSQQWLDVLDQTNADGTVDVQTAVDAFSLAFGPLPGATVQGTGGLFPDGTLALRWLVTHWDELTPDQQAAAQVEVPELAGLDGSGDAVTEVARAAVPLAAPSHIRSDFFYTELAKQMGDEIEAQMGRPLGIPVVARIGRSETANVYAETGVYNAAGGFTGTDRQVRDHRDCDR